MFAVNRESVSENLVTEGMAILLNMVIDELSNFEIFHLCQARLVHHSCTVVQQL